MASTRQGRSERVERSASRPWLAPARIFLAFALAVAAATVGRTQGIQDAEALISRGRFRDARRLAEEALRRDLEPAEAIAWNWVVAECYQLEGDYEEAEAGFASLVAAPGPVGPEAAIRLAKCRLQMWDGESASQTLASIDPRSLGDQAWEREELIAISTFVRGKQKEALALFEQIPRKSDAGWHYLGLIAFNSGDYKTALERFDRALESSPGDYYNRLYRASSLLELNRLDDARAALLDLKKMADTPEVSQILGRLELRADHLEDAEAHLERCLAKSPRNAEAQFSLVSVLRRLKRTQEAQAAAKRFQELHAGQQESLRRAYILNQRHEANPKDPAPCEALASHYLESDDPAAAERLAWNALRIDPRRVGARLCLARTLSRVGRFQESAVQYQKILRAHPENVEAGTELRELVRVHARKVED